MRLSFRLVFLPALLAGAMLTACQFLGMPASEEPGGCSPQFPATYQTQASVAAGTLEVAVTSPSGSPLASASVSATWVGVSHVYPQPTCPSRVEGETDAQGLIRWERMRTGPYVVYAFAGEQTASASVTVEAGQVTRVALTQP